jgi:hypothetical protein
MRPPVLIGAIAVVLMLAWLIGRAIGSSQEVGHISQDAYDTSQSWLWNGGASNDLLLFSLLLPILQFFCGSLYNGTRVLFGENPEER